jgi:hypothetical protein
MEGIKKNMEGGEKGVFPFLINKPTKTRKKR